MVLQEHKIGLCANEQAHTSAVDAGHIGRPAASLGRYCAAYPCCPATFEGTARVGSACLVSDLLPDPTYPEVIYLG